VNLFRKLVTSLVCLSYCLNLYAAENVSSVGAGKDYATYTLWEAAKDGDITAGNSEVGELYGTITDLVDIAGWVCDSDSKIIMRGASGERHSGTAASGAKIQGGQNGDVLDFRDNATIQYVEVYDLIIQPLGDSGASIAIDMSFVADGSYYDFHNNIIFSSVTSNDAIGIFTGDTSSNLNIYNNIFYNLDESFYGAMRLAFTSANVYNNTMYGCYQGIRSDSSGLLAKNNAAFSNGTDYVNTSNFSTSSEYNLSDDGTADDNNLLTSGTGIVNATIDDTNDVISLTAGSEDLHIRSGGDLDATGTDVYSDGTLAVTTDIDNETISIRDDLGADEITQAAAPAAVDAFPQILLFY